MFSPAGPLYVFHDIDDVSEVLIGEARPNRA